MNIIRAIRFKSVFKYVLSAGLLIFLIAQMDFSVLLQKSIHLNAYYLILAMIMVLCQIFFLNLRWHVLMSEGRSDISFGTSSLVNIAGYFANIIFITAVGGIIAKSGLAVRCGLSLPRAVFITFFDRLLTLLALIVLCALALPFLSNILEARLMFMLVCTVGGVIGIIGLFVLLFGSGVLKDFILSSRKRARILVILRDYTENNHLMMSVIGQSLIAQICFILSVYLLSLGIDRGGQSTNLVEFLALMPVLALISSLPISFGGWGVREGAFIYGLALIGFSMESAFLLSVQVGVVTLIAPFIVGLPYFLKSDVSGILFSERQKQR